MRAIRSWILLAATLVACETLNVETDYDPSASFPAYKTFAWFPLAQEETGNPRIDNPLIHARLRTAVEDALELKGYVLELQDAPDFFVGYHVSLTSKIDVWTINDHYGSAYRGHWSGARATTRVQEYEEGALILDIIDGAEKRLVWRASAQKRLRRDNPTPEESERRIREIVADLLVEFPPN